MKIYTVYKVISPSNKTYIGMTGHSMEIRKSQHKKSAKYKRSNIRFNRFQNALKHYGDLCSWEILETDLNVEEAIFLEKYYIKHYQSNDRKYGYNCNGGGLGNFKKHTQYTKDLIRKKNKENLYLKQLANNYNEYFKKNPNKRVEFGIKTMQNPFLKKQAIDIFNKYRKLTHVPIKIQKSNICLEFETKKLAAEYIGCSPQSISYALKNSGLTKGYIVKKGIKNVI